MIGSSIVIAGFPNPLTWAGDQVSGFVGDASGAGFQAMLAGLVGWVVDAAVSVAGSVFGFFTSATDPNLQADWFVSGTGPYRTSASIGATLLVLFLFAGIVQGVLSGDIGGMVRRVAVDLPISVLGMVGLVTVTQALVELTDVLSAYVLRSFESDTRAFLDAITSVGTKHDPGVTAFVMLLLGLATALAGIVLVAELAIREALIYIVVALAPLVFASRVWPATKGAARKLLELLCALVLSKLVIAVALAVASAAAVGVGSQGSTNSIPAPETIADTSGGSTNAAIGILLAAAVAFGVAAFSPLLIARLLPATEAAVVAQGVRGGPLRASQQGMSMANSAHLAGGRRLQNVASGRATSSATTTGTSSTVGTSAAGPTGVAAAAGTAGAKAATTAARSGAQVATSTAEETSNSTSPADRPVHPKSSREQPRATAGTAPKHPGRTKETPGGT